MARNFIQETIDQLRSSAGTIESLWTKFQAGDMDKETFEDAYSSIIRNNIVDTLQEEGYTANNGCKYHETCPTSEYFKKENI